MKLVKKDSDRFINSLLYKNYYVLIKKIDVFLGKQDCRYICKRCLKSNTSENMIIKHKQQCIQKEITSIRTSPESHLFLENHFHKNPLCFRI